MRALLFCLLAGCGASTEPTSPEASDAAPPCVTGATCTLEHGSCCDDVGFVATCVDGALVCDPCTAPGFELACGRRNARLTHTCERWARDGIRMGIDVSEYCAE